jgi:pseudaminic acid biosynthesis-associated methylase
MAGINHQGGGMRVDFNQTGVELWSSTFGDDYTNRNQVDWRLRMPFWKMIEERTGARSYFELGCNAGWNLSAIRRQFPDVNVVGSDINEQASRQAHMARLNVINMLDFIKEVPGKFEMVFTAGVLIHIEPEHLKDVMQDLIAKSLRYVLAIEYAAEVETIVEYRGHTEKCWKRPYGKLYADLGLMLIDHGNAGEGFDQCHYWLMEKP